MAEEQYTIAERLVAYRQCLFDLDKLYEQKDTLIKRVGQLQSLRLVPDKVQSGNERRLSEEERYVLYLEKVNKQISEYENALEAGKREMYGYIDRLPRFEWREMIRQYYFWRCEWWQVAEHLFISEPNLYVPDTKKGTQESINSNFMRVIYQWRHKALSELERIYNTPYIPAPQQLHLIGRNEENV